MSSSGNDNGQRRNSAMVVKDRNVRPAVFDAILVGFAARFWLKLTDHDLSSFLLRLGCNTGLHECVGNGNMDDFNFVPFYEILSWVQHDNTART